jgi:hypothetical protein
LFEIDRFQDCLNVEPEPEGSPDFAAGEDRRIFWWFKFCLTPFVVIVVIALKLHLDLTGFRAGRNPGYALSFSPIFITDFVILAQDDYLDITATWR